MANTFYLIEAKTLGSNVTSVTFSNIPQIYTSLKILTRAKSTTNSTGTIILYGSGTQGSSYTEIRINTGGSGAGSFDTGNSNLSFTNINGSNTLGYFGSTEIYIPNYTTTSNNKTFIANGTPGSNSSSTSVMLSAGQKANTAAISTVYLEAYESVFASGSKFWLYGIKSS